MATVSSAPRTTTITLASATAGPFDVGFRVFDTDRLSVFVNGLPRTDWSFVDFTFTDGFCDDVQIEFSDALADEDEIIIDGDLTPIRGQDYVNGDPRLVAKMNIELARVWSAVAEVKRDSKRAVRGFVEIDPLAQIDPQDLINVGTYGDAFPSFPTDGWVHFLTSGEIGLYMWMAPESVWVEMTASSSGQTAPFATRADFVTWTQTRVPGVGAVLWAGGFAYRRDGVSTHIADLPGYTWAGTPHLEHWGVVTSPERTGATTDYTTAVQAAVTAVEGTLIVTGWVKVSDKIVANSRCRLHCPEGRAYGGLVVGADFNLAATAILVPGDSTLSGGIGELGIYCAQTAAEASGLRADLIHYPPPIELGTITRCTIDALRIEQAWVGFSAIGNSGGMKIGTLEICAFSVPLRIDGPLDFAHIDNVHLWPFQASINANLLALYGDGAASSTIGRCDGLHITNLSSYQQAVQFEQPGAGIIPATFGAVHLDGDGARWINVSGTAEIGGFYSTKSTTPTVSAVRVEGGLLCITGTIRGGETPQVQVVGGTLQWIGGELKNVSTDEPAVVLSAGTAILAALRLDWVGTRTVPLIDQSGTGRLVLRDLIPSSTSPAQPLIRCQTDVDGAMVDALSLAPHTITLPTITGAPKGTYLSRDRTVLRLPSYADNAAASGAGLPIGTAYRTATGEMRIVV